MRNVKHYVFGCVYVCIYDKKKKSSLSLPLYLTSFLMLKVLWFLLILQSSTCSYIASTISISSLSIFLCLCLCGFFLRDLICCLLQSVFGPLHKLSGIGVREDEKDRERADSKRAMRGTVGSTRRTLLKEVCHFDFLFLSLIIQYYHDMALNS